MKKILVFIVVALLLVTTGCLTKKNVESDAATSDAVTNDANLDITLGSIQALTGETAVNGIRAKNGIDMAVEDINLRGINGRKLKVIHEDESCDQTKALNAANKLIYVDGIKIIIGPTCSSSALAVAPLAEKNKVIMLATIASTPKLKDSGDYIFRNRLSGEQEASKIADFSFKTLKGRTASILYINQENGLGYRDGFVKEFNSLGGAILNQEAYEKGSSDFKTQLTKIKNQHPEILFVAGQAAEHAVRQAEELRLDAKIVSVSPIETNELIETAGSAAEGIYYSYSSYDSDNSNNQLSVFKEKYQQRYNDYPNIFTANSYDATMLIGEAIESCIVEQMSNFDTDCIKDYLYSVTYNGVIGETVFDEFGEVTIDQIIKTVKNGEFIIFEE